MGIKRLEKDPDLKNIFDSLKNNAVGRNKNLWQFACFCSAQESRCSIALDGGWGTGKTFFLKQLQVLFDAHNVMPVIIDIKQDQSNQSSTCNGNHSSKICSLKEKTQTCFDVFCNEKEIINIYEKKRIRDVFEQIKKKDFPGIPIKKHVCFYYDAWLNDNADDPMKSIMYELISRAKIIKPFPKSNPWYSFLNWLCKFKCFRKHFYFCSSDVVELSEALFEAMDGLFSMIPIGKVVPFLEFLRNNNPVHEIEVQKRFHDAFDRFLNGLILNDDERLLVLIDELDRCKPTYAVQLLERIKHYLSNDKITFVFAINEEQLQYTVKAFYGEDFDAHRYLDRFFDFRLSLPPPNTNQYYNSYGLDSTRGNFDSRLCADVCIAFVRAYDLSLRESARYWQWVKLASLSFKEQEERSRDFNWKFIIYIIVPLVLGLKLLNRKLFEEFIKGKDSKPLKKLISTSPIAHRFVNSPEEAITETAFNDKCLFLPVSAPLDVIYEALFGNGEDHSEIDPHHFETAPFKLTKEMVDTIQKASNFMADFIKYDTNTEETANG